MRARRRAEFSKTTNERWRDSPKGVVSEQERESKKADYKAPRRACMPPTRRSPRTSHRVDQYTALAQFKQVTAPFDGTITERKIDIGNLVTAGSTLDDDAAVPDGAEPIRCACSWTCRRARPRS